MKSNLLILPILALLAAGCCGAVKTKRETQVTTFPRGGFIEYNGKFMGREPVAVILPQDGHGKLTARAVLRATPLEKTPLGASRELEPTTMSERIPDRILIDLSQLEGATNSVLKDETFSDPNGRTLPLRAKSPRGEGVGR